MAPELGGVAALTQWYLNIEPLPHQFAYTHATQKRIVELAGIRSGKTFGTALRAFYKCMTIPFYKFLNTSISTDQASVMYWLIRDLIDANPRMEKWIEAVERRPFPKIKLVNGSQMDFRSVGFQAELLRTLEFDWVNIDEAGWVDDYYTIQVLMGRTLGVRANQEKREGALTITTSPTSAPWLRDMVERGDPATRRYLTIRASIRDNIHLDQIVVDELFQDYSEEMARVELEGFLPDISETMFPPHVVNPCIDSDMNELLDELVEQEEEGAVKQFDMRYGLTRWEMPYDRHGHYILSADLGTMNIPKRGTSALFVANVAEDPIELVAWRWISGDGSWKPGLDCMKYLDEKYRPAEKALDTTGAQSILVDVLSDAGLEADGFKMNLIKDSMITESQLDLQGRKIKMPFIKELFRQLTNYRLPDKKITQDAAMAFFQLMHLSRFVRPKDVKTSTHKRIYQGRTRSGARTGARRTERRR